MSEFNSANRKASLVREVGERLRIQGHYGYGWSDVADSTACNEAADEIERLTALCQSACEILAHVQKPEEERGSPPPQPDLPFKRTG